VPDFTCSFSRAAKALPHYWEHIIRSTRLGADMRRSHCGRTGKHRCCVATRNSAFNTSVLMRYFPARWERSFGKKEQLLYSFVNADQIIDFLQSKCAGFTILERSDGINPLVMQYYGHFFERTLVDL
jgi:hypothetical protein